MCSLDAIGAQARATTLVAIDARRKEIYWAVYRGGVALTEPAVDRPDRVAQLLDGSGIELAVETGDTVRLGAIGVPVHDEPRYPPPIGLVELAADRVRGRAETETLTPLYLRRPDGGAAAPAEGGDPVTAVQFVLERLRWWHIEQVWSSRPTCSEGTVDPGHVLE